jgi:hypothetical protein
MDTNTLCTEHSIEKNRLNKWWRHRWTTIISISFLVLTVLVSTFFLLLNFVILAPEQLDSNTNIITAPRIVRKLMRKAIPTLGPGEF